LAQFFDRRHIALEGWLTFLAIYCISFWIAEFGPGGYQIELWAVGYVEKLRVEIQQAPRFALDTLPAALNPICGLEEGACRVDRCHLGRRMNKILDIPLIQFVKNVHKANSELETLLVLLFLDFFDQFVIFFALRKPFAESLHKKIQ
jgi:hypothetical protein